MTPPKLTVLSFGAGQDSSVLLEQYLTDPSFRERYAPNDFLVIMSDTGDEFNQTYQHVQYARQRCAEAGVEFVFLTSDMGYHSEKWLSLRSFYRTHGTIGSKAFPKTCSDRLKVEPIYRYLERWLHDRYGVVYGRKKGFVEFAERYGKIHVLLGIAKGEERRVADPSKNKKVWFKKSVQAVYPLIDMGYNRQACPFVSLEELEYLRRFEPAALEDWVQLEQAKLEKNRHLDAVIVVDSDGKPKRNKHGHIRTENKNYGVFKTEPLTQKIAETEALFKEWSDERITDYRYSHGHCTATVF